MKIKKEIPNIKALFLIERLLCMTGNIRVLFDLNDEENNVVDDFDKIIISFISEYNNGKF